MGEYGLRNKRELWRYKTMLSEMRGIARSLLAKSGSEREEAEQAFLTRLRRMGLAGEATSVDDTLDLDIRNLLERRLQSIVFRGGLAGSPSQARQLITHGHIAVGDHVVSVPGYLVSRADEDRVRYAAESAIAKSDHPARKALSRVEVATQSSPGRGPRKSAA